jgi:hypothetical protein
MSHRFATPLSHADPVLVSPPLALPTRWVMKLEGGDKVARRAGGEVGIILVPLSPSDARHGSPYEVSAASVENETSSLGGSTPGPLTELRL